MSANNRDDVQIILDDLNSQAKAITKQITEICWYMRGGVTRGDAWAMSLDEREAAFKLINENIKRTKEAKMPLL